MSPAFQETLAGNDMLLNSRGWWFFNLFLSVFHNNCSEIHYYDTVTFKHKDTSVYLHSHDERYPLTYSDGRVSSQGMVVSDLLENSLTCRVRATGDWLCP